MVLAFKLDSLGQVLGVYRPSDDYSDLLGTLQVGDTITVYYRPLSSNPIDIDVYQVEKSGRVVVDYADYSKNHASAANSLMQDVFRNGQGLEADSAQEVARQAEIPATRWARR